MSADERRRTAGSVEKLLDALVSGHTVIRAAEISGMSEASAHRRLQEPDVIVKLDELRSRALSVAADRTAALALGAVVMLGEVFSDPRQPAMTRVAAAREVLRNVATLREAATIEQRLTAVEATLRHRQALRSV